MGDNIAAVNIRRGRACNTNTRCEYQIPQPHLKNGTGYRQVRPAVTTVVSLLASLFSPIGIIRDFGVIAGMGVGMSLIVMLTLIPAGRTIIDQRRKARGRLAHPRPISGALPGVSRVAELLGRGVTRRPGIFIPAVAVVVIGLGFAATDLESEFSIQDLLPRGGTVLEDMKTLDAAVGGSTEIATALIKLEATDTRAILNLQDLTASFADEATRPGAAAGPIQKSFDLLVHDWTNDSGEPGDKYDPGLRSLLQEASTGVELNASLMQEFLDRLEEVDPALSSVLVNNPDGIDAAIVEFPVYATDSRQTRLLQQEIESLWRGADEDITATSEGIIGVTVMDSITDRQSESISTTAAAALVVLAVFFWVTVRQPALALYRGGAHRARPDSRAGHYGAPEHSLHHRDFNHYGPLHWHRCGLHHPHHSPLPRRIHPGPGPREGGNSNFVNNGLRTPGIGVDNGIRAWSAYCIPAGSLSAVWLHRRHYHPLLPHSLSPRGAAADDDLERLPEYAASG